MVLGGGGAITARPDFSEEVSCSNAMNKMIEKEKEATAMTFGFYSAVSCVTDALDRLHSTAASHKRAMGLEVMGRHAGWIALHGGLGGVACIVLLPVIPLCPGKRAVSVRSRAPDRSPG